MYMFYLKKGTLYIPTYTIKSVHLFSSLWNFQLQRFYYFSYIAIFHLITKITESERKKMQSYIKYYGKTFNNNKQLLTTTQVLSIRPYSVKVFVVPKRQISRSFQMP